MTRSAIPSRALALATLVLLLALGLAAAVARPAAAEPVAIDSAPALTWGFKASWRNYVGAPAVSDGAAVVPDPSPGAHQITWQFDSGSFDADSGTTVVRYKGSAHWIKYYYPANPLVSAPPEGYTGPFDIYILDVTIEDPVVTIGPDGASISAKSTSRSPSTWLMQDLGRIDLATLDAGSVTPTVGGGIATWSAIPATASSEISKVFTSNYLPGIAIDAVGFSYNGPGGAPDLSETFDAPGTPKLALGQNTVLETNSNFSLWWLDREERIAHYRIRNDLPDGGSEWVYRAFDLDTMQPIGEPLTVSSGGGAELLNLFDPDDGRAYLRVPGENDLKRWMRFDRGTGKYVQGELAAPIPSPGLNAANGLTWDPVGHRAWEVVRVVPDGVASSDHDQHQWQLRTYVHEDDDSWTPHVYVLPGFPTGLNESGYKRFGVVASDGSFIVLGGSQTAQPLGSVPQPATVPGAYRIVAPVGSDTAQVEPIAGLDTVNSSLELYTYALKGAGNQIVLGRRHSNAVRPGVVQELEVNADGVTVGPRLTIAFDGAEYAAVDPEDGTIWLGGIKSQRLVAVRDGAVVADQYFIERYSVGGLMFVGPNHAVYAQSSDGLPAPFGAKPSGVARFDRLGLSPTVEGSPADESVTLAAGEESESVAFSSQATGTPEPVRRWQVKAPGAFRFADVPGETGETLTVTAVRGMDGAQYRAVYENAAGRNATSPATLSVDYAPRVAFDPFDVSVVEGEPATFQVLGDGHPEPALSWQRRVGGFWQDIDPDDDNFSLDGAKLTVGETNVEQSGSLFRAKLRNGVSTAYSKVAKLTVSEAVTEPVELVGVHLDWTGSDELQRLTPNGQPSFFSAGASDGTEGTYRSAAPGVKVLQVAAGGGEAPATWATRGSHTSGGGHQLVRLTGGSGEVAPDGSATVEWTGSFTVNTYGGLVPFTVSDPELTVDPDGAGTLSGDLSGYGSSQANPGERAPVDPVADVTIATFSGASIDPSGVVTIAPGYAGVEVDVPLGQTAQNRLTPGWGAWPQAFVDFQQSTGLGSYWYTSGGAADSHKAPHPFVVNVTGVPDPEPGPGPDPQPKPEPKPGPEPEAKTPVAAGKVAGAGATQTLGAQRRFTVARLTCPAGGPTCKIAVRKQAKVRIAGRRYTITITGPARLGAGRTAKLRARLTRTGAKQLEGRKATVRIKVTIARPGATPTTRVVEVVIERPPE